MIWQPRGQVPSVGWRRVLRPFTTAMRWGGGGGGLVVFGLGLSGVRVAEGQGNQGVEELGTRGGGEPPHILRVRKAVGVADRQKRAQVYKGLEETDKGRSGWMHWISASSG